MVSASPLSEAEMKWQLEFERRLEKMSGAESYSTTFFDPRQLELAEQVLRRIPQLSYTVYGGFDGAERNALYIFPAHQNSSLPAVKAIVIEWQGEEQALSHRDLLGAVLALGLKRDQIGDIIMLQDGGAAMLVIDSKAEYICANLLQVGRLAVKCTVVEADQLPLAREEGRIIKGTVASLRADALISLGFGLSRSRVVIMIKGGAVKVNWRPVYSPAHTLKEGDQVSLKGRGRLRVNAVEGETRKGRMRVELKKYS